MLIIHSNLVEAMVSHAKAQHPVEACGVVAGSEESRVPQRFIPMQNMAQSETFFQFSSQEQLKVWDEMEKNGEEPVVIYHSHTNSYAYPSLEDIQYASESNAHYVIIATNPHFGEELRSFRIVNGRVTEERVQVLDTLIHPELNKPSNESVRYGSHC